MLSVQVEDLRSQLMRADQERTRFKMKMEEARLEDEIRDKRKRRTSESEYLCIDTCILAINCSGHYIINAKEMNT